MTKHYELFYVFPGTLSEEELPTSCAAVLDILKTQDVSDIKTTAIGKTRLAYPIKHIRYGYFYNTTFKVDTEKLALIKKKLDIEPSLLRSLIHIYDEEEVANRDKHVAAMKKRSARYSKKVEPEKGATSEKPSQKKEEVSKPKETSPKAETKNTKDTKKASAETISKKLDEMLDGSDIANI